MKSLLHKPQKRKEFLSALEEAAIKANPKNAKLRKIVIKHGGEFVQLSTEDSSSLIANICFRGFLKSGNQAIMELGIKNQCHYNSSKLWISNPAKYFLITGFALSTDPDGIQLWRQHSWVETSDGIIIETTIPRDLYFGYKLSPVEAESFAQAELV
jgi:hypothetical protein